MRGTTRFGVAIGVCTAAVTSPARNNVTDRQWNSWSLDCRTIMSTGVSSGCRFSHSVMRSPSCSRSRARVTLNTLTVENALPEWRNREREFCPEGPPSELFHARIALCANAGHRRSLRNAETRGNVGRKTTAPEIALQGRC